jgi:hypothetical protein
VSQRRSEMKISGMEEIVEEILRKVREEKKE